MRTSRQARDPDPKFPIPIRFSIRKLLYNQNCAGCHGADGRKGAAVGIGDPVYLALVSDDTMRSVVSKGRPGTAMSAFAQKEGGMLTDAQVDAIVHGIRQRWSNPSVVSGVTLPPYAANDRRRCATRRGGVQQVLRELPWRRTAPAVRKAGSVLEPAYLSLITDQGLRTIVITGRPDFNAPDWRNNVPGQPMTDQDITDVVACLVSHRPAIAKMPGMNSTAISRAAPPEVPNDSQSAQAPEPEREEPRSRAALSSSRSACC